MTRMHFLLACIGLLAAGTPWIVVRVAASRASVSAVPPDAARAVAAARHRLNLATLVLATIVTGSVLFVTPPSLTFAAVALGAFGILAGFGLAALHAIDLATHGRRVIDASERVASLRPRELASYLSLALRSLPYAIYVGGLAVFVSQLRQPMAGRRLFISAGFAGAAVVFLFLYHAWMREEVGGGQSEGGRPAAETSRRIREIFVMQTALVAISVVVANVLAALDWRQQPEIAVLVALAGAVAGVIGCAHALASGLTASRYAPVKNQRNILE